MLQNVFILVSFLGLVAQYIVILCELQRKYHFTLLNLLILDILWAMVDIKYV